MKTGMFCSGVKKGLLALLEYFSAADSKQQIKTHFQGFLDYTQAVQKYVEIFNSSRN